MASTSAARRTYDSSRRQLAAERTRDRILDAAAQCLAERGYAATSLAAIAEAAGVAVPTVYAAFASKQGIVEGLLVRLKGRVGIGERFRALLGESDPRRILAGSAAITRTWCEQGAELIVALESAAASDHEVGAPWRDAEAMRRRGQRELVLRIGAGRLRAGLDVERATDVLWALSSAPTYRALVDGCGWKAAVYEAWLAGATARELLA
jgi:AcrR family transcriptional regulator